MAITYTWSFPALDCYPTQGDHQDVVFTVHWRYMANDGEGHTAESYGTMGVTYEEGQDFVAFEDLTQEIVEGWVVAQMTEETIAAMQTALSNAIAEQLMPTKVSRPAPWIVTEPAPEPEPTPEP